MSDSESANEGITALRGSSLFAILTLVKGTLGVGILALPAKVGIGGIPLFVGLLLSTGYFTVQSVEMLSRGSSSSQKFVFEEISEILIGKPLSIVVGISMLINCFGSSVSYTIAIKQSLQTVFSPWENHCSFSLVQASLMIISILLCGCAYSKNISSLWFLSFVGLVGVGCTVISILYALSRFGVAENLSEEPDRSIITSLVRSDQDILGLIGVVSTITFALTNQYSVPQVLKDMADKSVGNVRGVAITSSLIPIAIYLIAGVCGFLCYGFDVKDDIVANFAELVSARDAWILVGISAIVLSVLSSFVLNNFAMKLSLLYFIPEKWHESFIVKYLLPPAATILTIACGLVYPNLSSLLGLIGASTGSIICYIGPAIISMGVPQTDAFPPMLPESGLKWFWRSLKLYPMEWLMIIIGLFLGIIGTISEFANCFKTQHTENQVESVELTTRV